MPSALKSLAAFEVEGWEYEYSPAECGYYVHRGYVYLAGAIRATPAATQTIYSGMPPGIAPAASTPLTFIIFPELSADARNPAFVFPLTFAAHIHPSGVLTLDEPLPAFVNTTPPEAEWWYYGGGELHHKFPQYKHPLGLGIILGGPRWPLPSGGLADEYPHLAFAGFLNAADFTDIDSTYAIHGSRVHLDGHVTAARDGAQTLMEGGAEGPHGDDLGLRPNITDLANFGGQAAEVNSVGAKPATGGASLIFLRDALIVPAGDSAPLARESPFNGKPESGNVNYSTPYNKTSEKVGEISGPSGGIENGEGFKTVVSRAGEYGSHECSSGGIGPVSWTCAGSGARPAPVSFNLEELLALCLPQPDWFLVSLSLNYVLWRGTSGCFPEGGPEPPIDICPATPCKKGLIYTGPSLSGELKKIKEVEIPKPESLPEGAIGGNTPQDFPTEESAESRVGGFLINPEPLYKGETHLEGEPPATALLWTPAQANLEIKLEAPAGEVALAWLWMKAIITPYYDKRQIGLKKGDVLDLTGTGWVGAASGEVNIGAQRSGVVKRPRILLPAGVASNHVVGKR